MLRIVSSLVLAALVATAVPLGLRADDGGDNTAEITCGGCVATGGGAVTWTGAGQGWQQEAVVVTVQFQSGKCRYVQAESDCMEKKCQMSGTLQYVNLPAGTPVKINGVVTTLSNSSGTLTLPAMEVPCDRSEPYVVNWNGNSTTFALACSKCQRG